MHRFILFLCLLPLVFLSCRKAGTKNPLEGSWRMFLVIDKSTGAVVGKPSTIIRDVELTFTFVTIDSGAITGSTPRNRIWSDFSIENNKTLLTSNFNMTLVGELPWGMEFLNNISSSQDYFFDLTGNLNISTTKKTLIFQKL